MIKHKEDLITIPLTSPQVKHASMQVLISPDEGWNDHVMRVVTLEKDGYTPMHKHHWPHINYFLEGEGILEIDGVFHKVTKDDSAYVPSDLIHQFRNTGDQPFKFICIVIKEGHIY